MIMGTRMEVAQLEGRMNTDDYRKLQGLFLVCVSVVSFCQFNNSLIHTATPLNEAYYAHFQVHKYFVIQIK